MAGGGGAYQSLQRMRKELHENVDVLLQTQTASMLGKDVLDRLAKTLADPGLALKAASGTREPRIGAK
eukprot:CAMPEP_0168454776 /NCGR_PEP_ID=MMETSP0228-20121227/50395_1 /TAXON_ID=133427 /ORGANISM="Protoceratium reticulatum, Strain CCCM 535 (=CCMP 1889)" /LENGTH=67 /DNA_ID=CAMNT_0008469573 /DNA_START=33 /DNA_END=233 /DNA_ORIENTATION=-